MDAAGLSISLAGIVLKLVIFSLDFVGDAKQVYRHGATDRNIDLSTVTKSVEDATTSLVKQLNSFDDSQVLEADDEQLKELSLRAAEIGRELAQKLRRVTADDASKWKSFKAAAIGMWDAGEIEKTEKRLSAIRDQVQLRILVGIRDKVDRSHDTHNSRILSNLEEVAKQHANSKEDTRRMIEKLNEADQISRGHHEELIQLGTQILDSINAMSISGSPIYQAESELDEEADHKVAERRILKLLWYSSIRSREDAISESYANTFQWIFQDPTTTGKPWDSFMKFLKGNTPTYWITGKPGCGKSTLMKFINYEPKTQELLNHWAGARKLIMVSYYFYYHGQENQKSEIGMIRSLLYSILHERRHLIPSAFETKYQDSIEGRKLDNLTLPEARRALVDLITRNPDLYFFISIDGLDEFDPVVSRTRVQSLIDFTHSLEKLSNIKVLVSSRPLAEFELGYDGRPSLSVHHLTREDIYRYAHEKLIKYPRMNSLAKENPNITNDLLYSIVESSLGVFIWVRLVIESLEDGLTNHESIVDLKKRVDDLPSDLEDLYRTMLDRIDQRYRPQTVRLLSFVYYMHSNDDELTLLDLWFAENADDNMVRNTPVKPIEKQVVRERTRELETLLKYRCMGLVEIEELSGNDFPIGCTDTWSFVGTAEYRATARFLHRSVYEFLGRHGVWDEFVQKYSSPRFSVGLSLFRSAILLIKSCRMSEELNTWDRILKNATVAGDRARLAELETKKPHAHLVRELDLAMRGVMPLAYLSCKVPANKSRFGEALALNPTDHWSAGCRNIRLALGDTRRRTRTQWPVHDNAHGSLMAFAAASGLTLYIQSQLKGEGRKVLSKTGLPLLGYALMPFHATKTETVKLLLDNGCDPNEMYNGMTLWEWFLWLGAPLDTRTILEAIPTMEAALLAGANPNGRILWNITARARATELDLKAWGLSWHPAGLYLRSTSVCTILAALIETRQSLQGDEYDCDAESIDVIDETIQRVIKCLEEHGAVKNEWKDDDSMRQIFLEICHRIDGTASLTQAEDAAMTELSIDDKLESSDLSALSEVVEFPISGLSNEPPLIVCDIGTTDQARQIQVIRMKWYRKIGRRLKRYVQSLAPDGNVKA
ncbi:hypothetical protein EV127DRAFT_365205 [Xylaria flabelliformis]|nr:hypothetical protein EV127DRAFT_365205 [Xylaria flabelliformis]